jgi:hypothetical protein
MSNDLQTSLEKSMEKLHTKSFDDWVTNFALNLENIWDESSASKLTPILNNNQIQHESAIVIGRGPSVKKKKHLELLADSNFKGTIICCDGILKTALELGVTPVKFPKFYVVSIDPYDPAKVFYESEIVKKYGPTITGIFSTIVKPTTVENARNAGINIHWLHSLFDYDEGKKSFNQLSAQMIRSKKKFGLPAIQTGGNVGTSSWFIAWRILKCNTVCLIGINHGWEESDSWEKIISHGSDLVDITAVDRDNPSFKKLFRTVHNPDFDCNCIIDPLFQFYSSALKEFISRSPDWLTTINSTEGGSIFGKKITGMKFQEFLDR